MFRFVAILFLFGLSACSSERTLNEANITEALGQHVQGASCVPFPYATSNGNGSYRIGVYGSPRREITQLLEAGIANQTFRSRFRIDFSISEQFLQYFPEKQNSATEVVCGSPERVAEIIEYTIPSENGPQMSKVKYAWETERGIPSDLRRAFPSLEDRGYSSATLILTSNGWRVADNQFSSASSSAMASSDGVSLSSVNASEFPFLGRTEISIPFTQLVLETYWSIIFFVLVAYFVPSIIGLIRRPPKLVLLAVFNGFVGWTIVGWLIALVWSFKGKKESSG